MNIVWILKLWDGTKVTRQTYSLADAIKGYYWDDITSIKIIDRNGIKRGWCETELFEAGRYAHLATNVAERCIWDSVEDSLWMLYEKLIKRKVKEYKIL